MSGGYSCARSDWQWLVRSFDDGTNVIEGVMFDDGHRIMFADMPAKQMDAYLKAGGMTRASDGSLSVAKGAN